ncbi:MAG: MBL fold metallo-hydrolase, partial [Bacteroidales bacterium]|nr:MBL fold metallo-hydrolase [Bacteroidales bacterium]
MKFLPQIGFLKSKLENKQNNFNALYENGKFKNRIDTPLRSETFTHKDILNVLFRKEKGRMPQYDISLKLPEIEAFSIYDNCFMWLGHSSIFVRLNGSNFLVDPVFSGVASPFTLIGPKEYKYSHTIIPQSLPEIDCIVVTHNHYDHLDYKTVLYYKDSVKLFIVPLGLSKILKYWGVAEQRIVELDYWQTTTFADVEITATPARHYSQRAFFDKDKTLWMSFVMKTKSNTLFFSGDSGYDIHFKEIGNKFSQFDWAFLECGQ